MTDPIESYWKEEASLFDQLHHRGSNPFQNLVARFLEARLRQMLPLFRRTIRPGMRVLDVGCGSGVYLQLLLQMGASVTGVDYSKQMLDLARPRLAAFPERGALLLGDAQHLMFKDASFDAVLAVGLLDYLPDTDGALAELVRVAKPGARLIVTIPKRPSPFFFIRSGAGNWLRRILLGLPPILKAVTEAEYRELLARRGVAAEEMDAVQDTMWIASGTRR